MDNSAIIKPIKYRDALTGNMIEVQVSDFYSIIRVNERKYYFIRETGSEFPPYKQIQSGGMGNSL